MRSERVEAIQLRRDGATYQDILTRLDVAKSTLWRWLKAEGLVDGQSQKYTERRLLAQKKAVEVVHRARLERTNITVSNAKREIGDLTLRELRLIGTALYWAEGAKQKESKSQVSEGIIFSNTDPQMLRLFISFLDHCCGVRPSDLRFRIYLHHETADAKQARMYWFNQLDIAAVQAAPITWKRHKPTIFRTNVGKNYHGLLRVIVPKSTDLNRRITGWTLGLCAAPLGSSVTVAQGPLKPSVQVRVLTPQFVLVGTPDEVKQ